MGEGQVVFTTLALPPLLLTLPPPLIPCVCCELRDIVVQPYGIPTSAPASTVVIAHAVRLIVFSSCGIPQDDSTASHAPAHATYSGDIRALDRDVGARRARERVHRVRRSSEVTPGAASPEITH